MSDKTIRHLARICIFLILRPRLIGLLAMLIGFGFGYWGISTLMEDAGAHRKSHVSSNLCIPLGMVYLLSGLPVLLFGQKCLLYMRAAHDPTGYHAKCRAAFFIPLTFGISELTAMWITYKLGR